MMKAYHADLFTNTFLQREAKNLEESGFINGSQRRYIETQLPAYQGHGHWLIRTGFFLLGLLLFSAGCSAISLFTGIFNGNESYYAFLLYAVLAFLSLELIIIRQLKHFASGIDDAFLFSGMVSLLLFLGFFMDAHASLRLFYLLGTLAGLIACLRYVDSFSAIIAFVGPLALLCDICLKTGTGRQILPFALLAYSLLTWLLQTRGLRHPQGRTYYRKALQTVAACCALLCYLSCNYLVVRELGEILMNNPVPPGGDIPLAPFFYFFTIACPLIFLFTALQKRNRVLLWISFLAVAFSVFTIRYYYQLIPVEIAMMAGGAIVFGLAWYARKKLEGKTGGLSFEHHRSTSSEEFLGLEALLVIEGGTPSNNVQPANAAAGGGGTFGGGGSGGNY